ncbi:carbonic anhydrase 7-like isoform X2 [Paroedura picta]
MESINPPWKLGMQVLLLLLLGCSYIRCEEWCYDKPSCGPQTWYSLGQCNGANQSPINIETRKALPGNHLGPIDFIGYEDRMRPYSLVNNGHSAEVKMKGGAAIFGQGLPGIFYLQSFHFHWGQSNAPGSEHTINGKRYDLELHIVHTKNNMSTEEASKDPDGIAVVAFFLKKNSNAPVMNSWKTLSDLLELIPEKGDSVRLNGEFALGGLLKTVDVNRYYRYHGSLTTPPCSESVIWTIFPDLIEVSPKVVKKFSKSLCFTTKREGRRMQNNYRPLQESRNRKVYWFQE